MYAIVKTGGKQYKVAPGDKLNIEKLPAEVGDKVTLDAICIVDGKKVEADPKKAAETKVEAVILDQFKGDKQLVFKFKKRKNYKKLRGHRQNLTRVQIVTVGSEKYTEPKKAASKTKAAKAETESKAKATKTAKADSDAAEKKTTAKASTSKAKTTKASTTKASTSKTKTTAKKTAEKADEKASEE